jgi:hypothetical protein
MKTQNSTMVTDPSAFITKSKQRIKQFNGTVYLKNGDEFEIELFNPTQNKILAKIKIDGKGIGGSGIVLRPGERVFLERYIDIAKKFLFETYKVNGNNSDVQRAIENNGNVEIEFYSQYIAPSYIPSTSGTLTIGTPWWQWNTGGIYYYHSPSFTTTGGSLSTNCFNSTTGIADTAKLSNCSFTTSSFATTDSLSDSSNFTSSKSSLQTQGMSGILKSNPIKKVSVEKFKEIETGRVEQGSSSSQSFTYDHTTFNAYYSWKTTWKLLPVSQKQIVSEDLVIHCTECGTKRKKDSHKFCPICGTKY